MDLRVEPILSTEDADLISVRCFSIAEKFRKRFGRLPLFCGRASGRVNLIGEHIDYHNYAVLPMAVDQDIICCASENESNTIILSNVDSKYPEYQCNIESLCIDKTKHKWYQYFLCGLLGMIQNLSIASDKVKGINVLVSGNIPPAAGLSSSSAMVCAASIVTLLCYHHLEEISRTQLAELTAKSERLIGTEGGGMDQAIIFLAQKECAKLIEFNPVKAYNVTLPKGILFVISNCCREMHKGASNHYNIRVAEGRIAAQVIAKKLNLSWRKLRILSELQKEMKKSLTEMCDIVRSTLHSDEYSRQEICEILEVDNDELNQTSLTENTFNVKSFKLHDRALHVYAEANRVLSFQQLCNSASSDGEETIIKLGELMNDSHSSCRNLYECSCDDLDTLVEICRSAGALGSRLTGAGWGGCAVSLIKADLEDSFLATVRQKFYIDIKGMKDHEIENHLFTTTPGEGARFFKFC